MMVGVVDATSRTTFTDTNATTAISPGMINVGITIIEITVRRSRSMSRNSFK
jgi:hypothetical protein